jgi:hypothetical protein
LFHEVLFLFVLFLVRIITEIYYRGGFLFDVGTKLGK